MAHLLCYAALVPMSPAHEALAGLYHAFTAESAAAVSALEGRPWPPARIAQQLLSGEHLPPFLF